MNKVTRDMIGEANQILDKAYAPYSNYTVACCICTDQDNFYSGINVENSSYGLTVCAETSAICKMVSAGEQRIKSIVVLAGTNLLCSPCGACRQRIIEFSTQDTMVYLCNNEKILHSMTISELLPLAFDLTKTTTARHGEND